MSPRTFATVAALAAPFAVLAADVPGSPAEGLYVGWYQEDALTNPEDPTPGSIYLSLPAGDSPFAGSMSFTYVGCQSESLGTVAGTKAGPSLKGAWGGSVDGTAQKGSFTGAWSADLAGYAGTYDVAGGKQHISVADCIDYWIAPRGTWELLPVGAHVPGPFGISVTGTTVSWTPPPGVTMSLVYVVDRELAKTKGARATIWQALLLGPGKHSADLRAASLQPGRSYVVAVKLNDRAMKRAGFASQAIVAP
jgi:hypothetical protein